MQVENSRNGAPDSDNNPCNLRHLLNRRFRHRAHVASLGLNEPTHQVRYPENPLILKILILTNYTVLFPICTGIDRFLFIVEYALVFQTACPEID